MKYGNTICSYSHCVQFVFQTDISYLFAAAEFTALQQAKEIIFYQNMQASLNAMSQKKEVNKGITHIYLNITYL